jgi:hypothetical protein
MLNKNSLLLKTIRNLLPLLFLIITSYLNGQVGINTDSPKVTLDVNAGTDSQISASIPPGFIAPRLTLAQLNGIAENYKPELVGTIAYIYSVGNVPANLHSSLENITSVGYYYFDGSSWNQFITPSSEEIPPEPWLSSLTGNGATSYNENISHNSQIGIGFDSYETPIDSNAQLEITSTNKGLLIPRLTKVQRDAITTPTVSMLIWNTDEKCFNFYRDDIIKWRSLCGDLGEAEVQINNCSSVKVNGTYTVGLPLSTSNTLQVTVNVTKPGNYSISGTTDVGIFFQKSGVFPSIGDYTIILPGYGAPTQAGDDIPVTLAINDYQNTTCNEIKIGEIKETTLSYSINSQNTIGTNELVIGESSNGKKISLNITVEAGRNGIYTIETNTIEGIKYGIYNIQLSEGQQIVDLYSNGAIMPKLKEDGSKYTGDDQLTFTVTGTGQTGVFNTAIVELISNEASFNVVSITPNTNNNNYYVSGKAINNNNYIDVVLNFTSKGTYKVRAYNADANVEFILEGNYTGALNSNQTFKINATTTFIPNKVNDYVYTMYKNDVASTSTFNLSVIYPKPQIIVYGWGYANKMLDALQDSRNFGPQGILKVENFNNSSNNYNQNISQFGGEKFTYDNLYAAINTYNAKIILITWDIINQNAPLTDDVVKLLSNFMTKRKGYVFFTNAKAQGEFIKRILDLSHGTNLEVVPNNTYPLKAATLPTVATGTVTSGLPTTNNYFNGKFGQLSDKYYVSENNGDYSWVGFTPTSLTSNSESGLQSLINLPEVNYNSINYPAASTLIYSTKLGFFMLPDKYSLIDGPNNNTGNNRPIGFNTNTGDTNVRILSNNGTTISSGSILTSKAGDWVLFGNIIGEATRYTFENYDSSVEVTNN